MRYKSIETFYWVAKIGSFHAVAERLNTTQPAISARVRALEEQLGTELFDRTPRGAALNSIGRSFLVYAERFIGLVNEVEKNFMDKKNISRTVRIGVSETVANTWFMEFMAEVDRQYPRLTIEMISDTSENLKNGILRNEIDLGFLVGPVAEGNARNHLLWECPFVWVASPAMALGARHIAPTELAGRTIVTFPRDTVIFATIHEALRMASSGPLKIHCSSSIRTILHMALNGWGVAALPEAIVADYISAGTLECLDVGICFQNLVYTSTYLSTPGSSLYEALSGIARDVVGRSTMRLT
jgi:DNA-binding transcriptional LysR family regulator